MPPAATKDLTSTALALSEKGYHVIPLAPSQKAAVDRNWTKLRLTPVDVEERWDENPDYGVGLLLGTEVASGAFLAAIDIDVSDDLLISRVVAALASVAPAKKGAKGITYICRTNAPLKKVLIKKPKESIAAVEVLASGQQTVLPPSVHPNGTPYRWIGTPLYELHPEELPLLDAGVLREMEVAVKDPESKMFLLNEMRPATKDAPGNMHDSGVLAVASMVRNGFTDDYIVRRVLRAMQDADERHGFQDRDMVVERRNVQEWLKSARDKSFDKKEDTKKADVVLVEWMRDEWNGGGNMYTRAGQVLIYQDGHFKGYSPEDFYKKLARWDNDQIAGLGFNGWKLITNTALAMLPEFPELRTRKVCLLNGTFDMDTGQLSPWSKDDFLITQLDITYDPDAACPLYDKVVRETLFCESYPDQTDIAVECYEEFVAMTMFECHEFQRFLVLEGTTRSGKSVLSRVASFMHARSAISSVMAHDLGREASRASMLGKLINITGETSTVSTVADDYLKMIVAGESVDVRHLYHGSFSTVLPTRLLIATNEPLRTKDSSGAITERAIVLRCDNYVPPAKRDPKLSEKLYDERAGIFNRMVAAWHRLRDRGAFATPDVAEERAAESLVENNPVLQWMLERTHEGQKHANPGYKMPDGIAGYSINGVLYLDYAEWAKMHGFGVLNIINFGTKLSQIMLPNLDVKPRNKLVGGRMVRVRNLSLIKSYEY